METIPTFVPKNQPETFTKMLCMYEICAPQEVKKVAELIKAISNQCVNNGYRIDSVVTSREIKMESGERIDNRKGNKLLIRFTKNQNHNPRTNPQP